MGQERAKKPVFLATSIGVFLGLVIAMGVAYFVTRTPTGIVNKVAPAQDAKDLVKNSSQQPVDSNAKPVENQTSTPANTTSTEVKLPFGLNNNSTQNQQQSTNNQQKANPETAKLDDKTRFEFYKILPNTEEQVNVKVDSTPNKSPEQIDKAKELEKQVEKEKKLAEQKASQNDGIESGEDTKPTKKAKITDDPAVKDTLKKIDGGEKASGGEIFYLQVGAFKDKVQAEALKSKVPNALIFNSGDLHKVRIGPFTSQESMRNARSNLGMESTVIRLKN